MKKQKFISNSLNETRGLARELVRGLKGGGVIGLIGDLGAGKTAFVQGLAKALGVKAVVNSPTFVLMKVYSTNHKVIKTLVHIDAYRLDKGSDLEALGVFEYMTDSSVLVVIEWADRVRSLLPKAAKSYYFKSLPGGEREISW